MSRGFSIQPLHLQGGNAGLTGLPGDQILGRRGQQHKTVRTIALSIAAGVVLFHRGVLYPPGHHGGRCGPRACQLGFNQRIIVSTTERWNAHAEDALQGQRIPVRRIGLTDLKVSGWTGRGSPGPPGTS